MNLETSIQRLVRPIAAMLIVGALVVVSDARAQTADAGTPAAATPTDATTSSDVAAPAGTAADESTASNPEAPAAEAPAAEAPAADAPPADAEVDAQATAASETADPNATPASTTTIEEADGPATPPAREPLAWRNSFFSWTHGLTFNSFDRGAQLSYNPNYYWWFFFNPRWYLDNNTFFVLGGSAFYELTNDDSSAYNHELQLGDLTLDLRRTIPFEGFIFIPTARLAFPVSKLSQAAQRIFNAGVGVTIVRPIPEALGMTIALGLAYRHWFGTSNVPLVHGSYPGNCGGVNDTAFGGGFCDQASGSTVETDRLLASLTLNVTPFEGFTLTFQAAYIALFGAPLDSTTPVDTLTGSFVPPESGASHVRHATSYTIAAAYDIVSWFNLSLGISNSTNLATFYADDGSVRSPFNPDTQLSLTGTLTLDAFFLEVTGATDEEENLTPEQIQRRRQGLAQRSSSPNGGRL